MKLIDVSEHNGIIDWEKVKPHIDGAIIRCGYGMDLTKQDDKYFKRNADECTRLGIPFGVYIYSYATNTDRAKSEAAHVLRLIKGYKLSFPVYYDLEESGTERGAVERAIVFGDIIEKAGYWCGVYANYNWWTNYLKGLERFTKWVAQYNKVCDYEGANLDIWQYTSKGNVDGIEGYVDMNECYRNFPKEIHGNKKTIAELAQEVLDGKHGNGKTRVQSLGDLFDEVQAEVNRILGIGTIKVGSIVRVKKGAKDYKGCLLNDYVYERNHTVKQIDGDRVVITFNGIVVAAVHKKNLTLA
jgi:GH25 family lysozyme M1 (1,4-beta-N-acetylmuramidase)